MAWTSSGTGVAAQIDQGKGRAAAAAAAAEAGSKRESRATDLSAAQGATVNVTTADLTHNQ